MTINEVVFRDMIEAERQERLEDGRGAHLGASTVKWCCEAAGVLAVALAAILVWCCVSDAAHVFNISR